MPVEAVYGDEEPVVMPVSYVSSENIAVSLPACLPCLRRRGWMTNDWPDQSPAVSGDNGKFAVMAK